MNYESRPEPVKGAVRWDEIRCVELRAQKSAQTRYAFRDTVLDSTHPQPSGAVDPDAEKILLGAFPCLRS
jgi:hypothetical protein